MATNMDVFNKGVALIFSTLYNTFPARVYLKIDSLDKNVTKDERTIYGEAAVFLREEGFIRCGNTIESSDHPEVIALTNAQLTSKGLSVLKAIPESLEKHSTLMEEASEALQQGSKELLSKFVSEVISIGLSLGAKTLAI